MSSDSVPPYEGRRTSGDVAGPEQARRGGAKTGGATGPVEDSEYSAPDPESTPGGATGLPADEQPASEAPGTDRDEGGTGPAHEAGAPRAEDQG